MGKKGFIISLSTVVGLIIGIIIVLALYDVGQAVVGLIPTKARINKDNLDSFQSLLEDLKQLGEEGEKQGAIYSFTESTSLITLNKGDITFPEIRERYYACKQVSCICVCQQGDCKSRVICESIPGTFENEGIVLTATGKLSILDLARKQKKITIVDKTNINQK